MKESLGGRFITITFEETIAGGVADGELSLSSAIDGTEILASLSGDNIVLWDVFAYADPGFIDLVITPDGEGSNKFRVGATKYATRIPFAPPKLIEVDLSVKYTSDVQTSNLYLSFSGMRISESGYAKFLDMAYQLPTSFIRQEQMLINIQKILNNQQAISLGGDIIYSDIGIPTPVVLDQKRRCSRGDRS